MICLEAQRFFKLTVKMNDGVRTCETVMLLVVSVPVLSEQMTSAHPRASTVGSLRTTALRLAIRITPKARVTVTTMGRPWNMQRAVLPYFSF